MRSLARARELWLLTLPTEQPSVAAIWTSVRSSQYLSSTTSRCLGGSEPTAASTDERSPCQPAGSPDSALATQAAFARSGNEAVRSSATRRFLNALR